MSRKAILAVAAVGLCGFLLALHALRRGEPGSEQGREVALESSNARDNTIYQERLVDGPPVEAPRGVEYKEPLEPVSQVPASVPAPMAQALESMGVPARTSSRAVEAERAFAAEPVDPSWAGEMEARITDGIAELAGTGLITMEVKCRTSTCRIQLAQQLHGAPEQQASSVLALHDSLLKKIGHDSRPVHLAIDRSGVATSLVYLPQARATTMDGAALVSPVQGQ